jgi:DNA-binding NarL/FixJ family response regulator
MAILDADGIVTWADEAWAADGETGLARVGIGRSLVDTYREQEEPIAQVIADAIAAIVEGKATYFEIEHRASRETGPSILTSVAALRGGRAGAAVIHRVVGGRPAPISPRLRDVSNDGGPPSDDAIERLTPREREVLDFMAAGLDNRAIAAKLRIQYTTVRGHVRAVIEKLGARSRLEAVARAYQSGWVTQR